MQSLLPTKVVNRSTTCVLVLFFSSTLDTVSGTVGVEGDIEKDAEPEGYDEESEYAAESGDQDIGILLTIKLTGKNSKEGAGTLTFTLSCPFFL